MSVELLTCKCPRVSVKTILSCLFSISLILIGFPTNEPSLSRSGPILQCTGAVSLANLYKFLGVRFNITCSTVFFVCYFFVMGELQIFSNPTIEFANRLFTAFNLLMRLEILYAVS